jgi:hypothetical protein
MNSILILHLPISDLSIEVIAHGYPSGILNDHTEATNIADGPDTTETQPTAGIPDHLRGVDSDVKLGTVLRK